MFGVSFTELLLIGAVALIVVGPNRLPGMLGTLGRWSNKLRRTLFEVRSQSGIDDILRSEGISGGLHEIRALRNAVRGDLGGLTRGIGSVSNSRPSPAVAAPVISTAVAAEPDPYATVPYDRSREYPDEGCDAYGAIPDDLWAATHPELNETKPQPGVAPALTDATLALAVAATPNKLAGPDSPTTDSETPIGEQPTDAQLAGHDETNEVVREEQSGAPPNDETASADPPNGPAASREAPPAEPPSEEAKP